MLLYAWRLDKFTLRSEPSAAGLGLVLVRSQAIDEISSGVGNLLSRCEGVVIIGGDHTISYPSLKVERLAVFFGVPRHEMRTRLSGPRRVLVARRDGARAVDESLLVLALQQLGSRTYVLLRTQTCHPADCSGVWHSAD